MWHQNGFYLLFHKKSINWRRKKEKNKNNNQTFKKDQINSLTYLWKKKYFCLFHYLRRTTRCRNCVNFVQKTNESNLILRSNFNIGQSLNLCSKKLSIKVRDGLDFEHCIRGRHYLPCYTFVRRSFPNQIPVQKGIPCLTLFSSNHQFHCSRTDMFQLMQQCFQLQKLPQPL